MGAVSEFWSLFHLEIDKAGLSLHEFKHEVFRNIGSLVEAYIFPHLRDLLTQIRLTRGKATTYAQNKGLSLGKVVDELHSNLSMPELVSPPPWGIRLNQWRNVAQHYRSCVRNDKIHIYYGEHPNQHEIVLTRNELWNVCRSIYCICDVINTARTLFCVDHIHIINNYRSAKLEVRSDATIFALRIALATQGFDLVDLQIGSDCAVAKVRDVTCEPYEKRMIHASQFVYPVWVHFKKETVIVKYIDKEGNLRLTTTGKEEDFRKVANASIPFSDISNYVEFRLEGD